MNEIGPKAAAIFLKLKFKKLSNLIGMRQKNGSLQEE